MWQLNYENIAPCHHEKMPNKQRKYSSGIKLNRCAPSAPKFGMIHLSAARLVKSLITDHKTETVKGRQISGVGEFSENRFNACEHPSYLVYSDDTPLVQTSWTRPRYIRLCIHAFRNSGDARITSKASVPITTRDEILSSKYFVRSTPTERVRLN